jgi:predicted dehydrogenase
MRIGIVGAENSHTVAVAKTLNVNRSCGSARVVAVWGETKAFAQAAAENGQIPRIVKRPEDMIGEIDGVMVDHRHAKYHIPAVTPFIQAGIPAFVDKPFSYTLAEGWKFIQLARKRGVPVTSFSTIPLQEAFRTELKKQIEAAGKITAIQTVGPCDLKSKWGGIFFYGIHQVDALIKAFGLGIESVQVIKAAKGNPNAVAVLRYRNGGPVVSMSCIAEGSAGFTFRAIGTKGQVDFTHKGDPDPYLTGVKTFLSMFRTGKEPFAAAQILEPIAVLEALQKSVKTGKCVRVAALPC